MRNRTNDKGRENCGVGNRNRNQGCNVSSRSIKLIVEVLPFQDQYFVLSLTRERKDLTYIAPFPFHRDGTAPQCTSDFLCAGSLESLSYKCVHLPRAQPLPAATSLVSDSFPPPLSSLSPAFTLRPTPFSKLGQSPRA